MQAHLSVAQLQAAELQRIPFQQEDPGREGTNQLQKEDLEEEPQDAQDANSLDIW